MKTMKRIGAILAVLVMFLATPITTSASSGINANEQTILDVLSGPIELNGRTTFLPAQYINQARNYLMSDGVDLTVRESGQIISAINEARTLAETSGYTSFSEMPASLRNQLVVLAQKAGAVIGLTISVDPSGAVPTVSIVDGAGSTVIDGSDVVKQTGVSLNASMGVVTLLVGAIGACALVAKKRNLFASQAD